MSCPRCNSPGVYARGDDPAPYVRCIGCQFMYIEQKGPTSHDTLKEINERLKRIEDMLNDKRSPGLKRAHDLGINYIGWRMPDGILWP